VEKNGAGYNAGLRLGDVITKMGDKEIASMEDLTAAKKGYKAGDTVEVTYYRDGEYHTTQLTFDEQPVMSGTQQEEPSNQQGGNEQYGQYPYYGGQYGNGFDMFDFYDYFFGRN